jgi:hypothetical protein
MPPELVGDTGIEPVTSSCERDQACCRRAPVVIGCTAALRFTSTDVVGCWLVEECAAAFSLPDRMLRSLGYEGINQRPDAMASVDPLNARHGHDVDQIWIT